MGLFGLEVGEFLQEDVSEFDEISNRMESALLRFFLDFEEREFVDVVWFIKEIGFVEFVDI